MPVFARAEDRQSGLQVASETICKCQLTPNKHLQDRLSRSNPAVRWLHKPLHFTGTGGEAVEFQTELVQCTEIQIRQWIVVLLIKCQVTSMLEAAAGEQDWHVPIVMTGGVTEIRGQQHHSLVEQRTIRLIGCLQLADKKPLRDGCNATQ